MSLVGRLEDLALSDIFQILGVGRKTGTLIITGEEGAAAIVFRNGQVVRAENTLNTTTLGDEMVKRSMIKQTTLDMAREVQGKLPDKSIAEILLDMGAVKKDLLEKIARKRIEKIVYNLLIWEEGNFQFELEDVKLKGKIDVPDAGWELIKGLSPEYLLMEGARVQDESAHGMSIVEEEEFEAEEGEEEEEEEEEEGGWDNDWSAPPARKDITSLKALTQELRLPATKSEITLLIVRFASDIFQRGVLFIVHDDYMHGFGQFGLELENADAKIRETTIKYPESPFLNRVIDQKTTYKGPLERDEITEKMIRDFGGGWPQEIAFFPILSEGKVAAIIYCDNLPSLEPVGETEGLEIFISQASLALEMTGLQQKMQEMQNKG